MNNDYRGFLNDNGGLKIVKNVIGTINANFEIISQGKNAVIGYRKSDNSYVSWNYKKYENGNIGYFWGHYSNDYQNALKSFNKKELY